MVALKKSSIIITSILVNKTSICRFFSSRPQRRYQSKAKPKLRTKHKKVKQQTKTILPVKKKQPHKENATHCDHHQDHKKKKKQSQSIPMQKTIGSSTSKFQHCYSYITLRTNRGKYSKMPIHLPSVNHSH